MKTTQETKARTAVREAANYLQSCGIRLPHFRLTTVLPEGRFSFGGSFVTGFGGALHLNMGRYPTRYLRNWFAMHELGHVLWELHQPLRWKRFREVFGEPTPEDYDDVHKSESWKTPITPELFQWAGLRRPEGHPSWYGARGGGEERFCEIIGFMYARGDFTKLPPDDLSDLWNTCWEHGLARMT